jgi:hypothetical protein
MRPLERKISVLSILPKTKDFFHLTEGLLLLLLQVIQWYVSSFPERHVSKFTLERDLLRVAFIVLC